MLDWVGILGGEGDGGGEAMVELVDRGIEGRTVEEAVGVVEEDLPNEDAEHDVAD